MAGRSQRPSYGGQAVLEGVMIRGPRSLAVAVRRTDGRIVLKKEPLVPWTQRSRLFGIPFIRGTFALLDAMVTGLRALSFSADVAMEEENEKQAATGTAAPADKSAAPPVEERAVAAGKGVPAWSLAGSLLL
ncbi:MAG TPA: DUF1385 domain-containing protein, partial [Armatimonadota bacterium]|nr:DUF1385 domain-containing protein [Armatimonadota bacterium]